MNLINRIIVILLILIAMILIPLLLIFPEQAEFVLCYTADIIQANLVWLASLSPAAQIGFRAVMAVIGIFIFLVGIGLIVLEFIRFRKRTVRLRDGGGEVMMDGVAGHLAYHVDLLADVLRVKPKTQSKGKSVQVELLVETAPGVHIPTKTAEIVGTARQVIEDQLGLKVDGEIKVVVKPVPYSKSRRTAPVQTPAPAASPAPAPVKQDNYVPPAPKPAPETRVIEVKTPPAPETIVFDAEDVNEPKPDTD